ncbi:MAG: integrase DNA-binding domain-containing protein [Lachnospiraceae bacterium]|nr:integrase DNA-binding domain-containing protein [Lachnospiraceae bacterium]
MTIVRKDQRGRNLRMNESVMPNGRYRFDIRILMAKERLCTLGN